MAPLLAPLTKVGIVNVCAWFNVKNVNGWTSNKERPHSLVFALSVLYEPDSNLKS